MEVFLRIWLCLLLCLIGVQLGLSQERSDTAVVSFLEQAYGVKFSDNNHIVLLPSGEKKFEDLFKAVAAARKSIHLEYFNFRNDSISEELFTLLAQKAAEGVEVRALFDGFGNSSNNKPLKKIHLQKLRERGVEIYEFDPVRFPWLNHAFLRDHRKIVVIDGMVAYTGGMNVADYYIHGKPEFGEWRDMHLRVEGDAVGCLQSIFIRLWNQVTGQDLKGAQYYPGEKNVAHYFPKLPRNSTGEAKKVGVVCYDPDVKPNIICRTFVECIDKAQKQIQIVNPYFTLNRKVKRALKRALERGVDVQVMVSEKSDITIVPRIVEYNTNQLMKRGAQIFVYQGGFHHTKIMMVDSLFSYVGSANLNSRSLRYDYECNLLIADKYTTEELQLLFEVDKQVHCYKLTPERRKELSKWRRFKGWLFHFLSPLVLEELQSEDAAERLLIG